MKDQFVLDMVNRNLENVARVFKDTHNIIHAGGGTCEEAAFAQMIAVRILSESMVENISEEQQEALNGLFEVAKADFNDKVSTAEAEIMKLTIEKKKEFAINVLRNIFGSDITKDAEFMEMIGELETPVRH